MEEDHEVHVVVGTYDSLIRGLSFDLVHGLETGLTPKFSESSHSGSVRSVASCGRFLASGGVDETIKLYNMKKLTEVGTLLQHEVILQKTENVDFTDMLSEVCRCVLNCSGTITWLEFYLDKLMLSGSDDGTVCVWKCGSWKCTHTLSGHKSSVTGGAVHPSGRLALTVARDRTIRTWNLTTGQSAFVQKLRCAAELVKWTPIGDQYVVCCGDTINVYDVQTGASMCEIAVGKHINAICFIKDTVLAVASESPHIQLYSITTGECCAVWEGRANRVKALCVVPGADFVFSASSDGSVKVWKMSDKHQVPATCVSEVQLSSRLTCMTLVYQHLLKTTEQQKTGDEHMTKITKPVSTPRPTQHHKKIESDKRAKSQEEKKQSPMTSSEEEGRVREKSRGISKRKLLLQKIKRKRKLA